MKVALLCALAFVAVVQPQPVTQNGECQKEQIEELNKCFAKMRTMNEARTLEAEVHNLYPQCIPTYQSNCTARYAATEGCWVQSFLDTAADKSMQPDDRRKTMVVLYKCMPHFPQDLYRLMGDIMKQQNSTSSGQQTGQMGGGLQQLAPYLQAFTAMRPQNDTCSPDAQQLTCLLQRMMQNQKVMDNAGKILDQISQCYQAAPAPCRFPENTANQDCQAADMKAIADRVKIRYHECIFSKSAF